MDTLKEQEDLKKYYNFNYNSQSWVMKQVIFGCPICYRTIKVPIISIYQPNLACCGFMDGMQAMDFKEEDNQR